MMGWYSDHCRRFGLRFNLIAGLYNFGLDFAISSADAPRSIA
ncbi:MAG: hypothetical protein AAGF83_14705 [Cyanobacteria bacterium P01_G01_bin.67]